MSVRVLVAATVVAVVWAAIAITTGVEVAKVAAVVDAATVVVLALVLVLAATLVLVAAEGATVLSPQAAKSKVSTNNKAVTKRVFLGWFFITSIFLS